METDDAEIVANITAICDEFEAYGYRRVGAQLRHRGMVVNSKKIRRLMREHDLHPSAVGGCGQTTATTISDLPECSIDVRVAVADKLKAAIRVRQPPKGCIHHSDRWFAIRLRTLSPPARNPCSSALWADVAIPMTMPRPRAL